VSSNVQTISNNAKRQSAFREKDLLEKRNDWVSSGINKGTRRMSAKIGSCHIGRSSQRLVMIHVRRETFGYPKLAIRI